MGYIRVVTHLLTIDPNFLGHPSGWSTLLFFSGKVANPAWWQVMSNMCIRIASGSKFMKIKTYTSPKNWHDSLKIDGLKIQFPCKMVAFLGTLVRLPEVSFWKQHLSRFTYRVFDTTSVGNKSWTQIRVLLPGNGDLLSEKQLPINFLQMTT